ncbi:MFS transporter [Cellulomonas fimi]|uniref:Major facilitator superfamily MFS_1 n=1 Tax=Cellulomonas fimi (strain ATCC 484 / DSM 20113 / JCM 1341 / CCUG 24087 / LMG 16345 / NBRC 15513 / NCIMB 8980 / NCTC 7547 / NRS-133) TaxID=590998 RepID=F4GY77_CELFA|nr:MFS transporter [Cellulomonas fimi]AEE44745.1 major facilitator superfamily MFS_1 [Cellulomonas fimi ATCC 484]VEH27174.1 Inner membrane protein ybjJ [Cellulomonas fimi]
MSAGPTAAAPSRVDAVARRARAATAAGFAAQGFVYALLLTSLEQLKDRYGIDDGQITLVVLGVCVMAALGTVAADRVARGAAGSRGVLAAGLCTLAVAVALVSVAPGFGLLAASFAVYGVGLGLVDAGTNMQAVSVQRVYGRSLLTTFYAAWSVGGIAGAVLVSVTAGRVPIEPAAVVLWSGILVAAVAAALVAAAGWHGGTTPAGGAAAPEAQGAVPWGPVLLLGLGVVAYYVADTAVSTWSTIYLGDVLDATSRVAPLGYAAYLATTLVSRVVGDPLVRRYGRGVVVRVGALVGAAGLLLVVVAPGSPLALAGFALTGAGLGVLAPLCFSAAGSLAPGHADAVVARLNVFNYVGAVLGGVLVGAIGTGSTLRAGFVVPVLLVVAVAVVAPRFGHRRDPDRAGPLEPAAGPAPVTPTGPAVDGPAS